MPLNKDDYLDTVADYKEYAENCGAYFKKSWSKDQIKSAILEVSPDAKVFDDALKRETREIINEEDFKRIEYYMNALSGTELGETLKFARKEVCVAPLVVASFDSIEVVYTQISNAQAVEELNAIYKRNINHPDIEGIKSACGARKQALTEQGE